MNFINYYFGANPTDEITILLGENFNNQEIEELFKLCSFKQITFIKNNFADQLCSKIIMPDFRLVEIDKLSKIKTLVLSGKIDDSIINLLKKIEPQEVVGSFEYGFDTVSLWKKFRKCSKKIVFSRFVNDLRNEVLSWEKNDSGCELSVILPVYNVENYVEKCIKSITKTKSDYFEFIFVSDGSPDKSVDIIKNYQKHDPRIKLYCKENEGCASARQYGLEKASGRYVGFVDPDDFVDETMFDKLFDRALQGSYEISYCGYNEIYEDSGITAPINDLITFPYDVGTTNVELIDKLIAYRRIAIWRGIYLKEFIEKNKICFHKELKRFDDLPFKVETLARCKSIVSVPEYLYNYRLNRPGQDVSFTDKRLYIHFDIFKILDNFFSKYRSSKQLEYYLIVKLDTHLWALSIIDKNIFEKYKQKAKEDLLHNNTKKQLKNIIKFNCDRKRYKQLKKIIK